MAGQKIFEELELDIQEILEANISLHKFFTSPTGNGWAQWSDVRKWINFNIGSIDTVRELAGKDRYRDCYIILRSVLEAYLLIKLSTLSRVRYFDLLPLPAKPPQKTKEKPQDLLIRAKAEASKDKNVISLKLMRDKSSPGRYWVRMLYKILPVGNTKTFVPMHYFYLRDYDPEGHYLSRLLSKNSWEGTKWDTSKHQKKQKDIKKTFLELDQIYLFLQVNKFATPRQVDALRTHYNFLSKYTHSTTRSYEEMNSRSDITHLDDVSGVFRFERNHKILTLLYALFLGIYFLELQLDYFGKEPDLALDKKRYAYLNALMKKLKNKYSFFWFIYGKPHSFDLFMYKLKKQNLAHKKIPNIPYYVNPLSRLKDMTSGWGNPVLGQYVAPKILTD